MPLLGPFIAHGTTFARFESTMRSIAGRNTAYARNCATNGRCIEREEGYVALAG